jgi:hypothetical protein
MPQNVQNDLSKFKTKLDKEIALKPESTIGTTQVVDDDSYYRGIPVPEDGFIPGPLIPEEPEFVAKDINTPNQGPMGREEKMIAKLFSSLVPEANRGVVNKTPGSAREIR